MPKPQNLGAAALLLFMGLMILRMGFVQKSLAGQAAKWPVTAGRIDASGLQALRNYSGAYRRWTTVFKSRIVYSYAVAGQRYTSDRVTFGATVTASMPGLVRGQSQSYAEGSKVDVHYDPANPGSAVLECRVRGLWVLWVCSVGFLGGAACWSVWCRWPISAAVHHQTPHQQASPQARPYRLLDLCRISFRPGG